MRPTALEEFTQRLTALHGTQVIPYSGTIAGGTRVAVLGTNFVDSPSARVRFDNIDVMPVFHGPRTLICTTPPHHSGA